MGHTRTQRLARQIRDERGIKYTEALRLAEQQIDDEYAARDQRPASAAEQDGDDR